MKNAEEHYIGILKNMRDQGAHDNPETLYIGTMLSSKKVEIDGLILDDEDFLIADYLKEGYSMPLVTPYVYNSYHDTKDAVKRKGHGLKKGDKVAVMKCENTDTYVIFCKVVSA